MQVEIDDGHVNILRRNEACHHDRVHFFLYIRTIFIRTLRQRFAPKFKKMYGLK